MNIRDCINIIKNCTMMACEYHIRDRCDYRYDVKENRFETAKNLAINALEKQIPKKATNIIYRMNGYSGNCPICKRSVIKMAYCSGCGQKLDWQLGERN